MLCLRKSARNLRTKHRRQGPQKKLVTKNRCYLKKSMKKMGKPGEYQVATRSKSLRRFFISFLSERLKRTIVKLCTSRSTTKSNLKNRYTLWTMGSLPYWIKQTILILNSKKVKEARSHSTWTQWTMRPMTSTCCQTSARISQ